MSVTATLSGNQDAGSGSQQQTTQAPVTDGQQTQQQTQQPNPALANAPTTNRPQWADHSWTDDDQKQWDAKGFKSPLDIWRSYGSAQKIATDPHRVSLPRPGDENALKQFHRAIGVPDTADKYEITIPEQNGSKEYADMFRQTAHKLGLTPAQVKGLNEAHNQFVAQTNAKTQELSDNEFSAMVDTAKNKLRTEWGTNYDKNYGAAEKALMASGLTPAHALAIESVIGTEAMIRAFSQLGSNIGEKGFVNSKSNDGFGRMTVADARAKVSELQNDKPRFEQFQRDWQAKRETPDTKLWKDMHEIIGTAG